MYKAHMATIPAEPCSFACEGAPERQTGVPLMAPLGVADLTYAAPVYPGIIVQVIHVQYNWCAHGKNFPFFSTLQVVPCCPTLPLPCLRDPYKALLCTLPSFFFSCDIFCPKISAQFVTKKPMQKTAGSGESC